MDVSIFSRIHLILGVLLLQACGGGGGGDGSSNNSSGAGTPKTVLASSYENKARSDIPPQLTQLPKLTASSGIVTGLDTGMASEPTSLAVADFQRNGSYSAFVITSDRISKSKAFFVGYNAASGWSDLSDTLLPSGTDRTACLFPQQSAVADFNQDGKPDVYVACSGSAGSAVTQVLFMSQPNGTYQKSPASTWPSSLNASSVAVADIDKDQCMDVVTTDSGSLKIYKATCGGTYTLSEESISRRPSGLPSNILSVFLVPNANNASQYDLLVGADASSQAYPFKWFANSGSGFFDNTDTREYALQWGGSSNRYEYWVNGANAYIYITNSLNQTFVKLAKIVVPSKNSNITPSYYTPANTTTPVNDWAPYLRLRNNLLEPYDAGCGATISTDDTTRCGKRYPLDGYVP